MVKPQPIRLHLDSPLTALPGVGPARAAALAEAGFGTVGDLLRHLPSRWEDRRTVTPVAAATLGSQTFVGRLEGVARQWTRRRGPALVRGSVIDESGSLPVVWFNRPYLANQVRPEVDYLLHGPVKEGKRGLELLNPSCEPAASALHAGRVTPVYPASGAVGAALLRRLLARALAGLDLGAIPETLPRSLLARHGLPPLGPALAALHEPAPGAEAERLNRRESPEHGRLIYGELIELQLVLALARARRAAVPRGFAYRIDDALRAVVREVLPFRLTAAQKRALGEIVADLGAPAPMLRLLQGDVGSGKTIVAALALVVALESGLQGAFMAPTELLAEQHFASLERLLGKRYRLALWTSSTAPDHRRLGRALAAGQIQLAVGTHALLEEGVRFRRLGLAVVDEQHRFGVDQRRRLEAKGERPDLLAMTATPIPRSLALTLYGDLALSTLDELPPGRQAVATELVPEARRAAVYRALGRELAAGGRAYVVFPRIDDSAGDGGPGVASLARDAAQVRRLLGDPPAAVVHGRMPAAERASALADFAAGRVRLLLATTVVEVGVDVPEATAMVLEAGERFGLAQLHQLRGRVGRGSRPSRCIVVHGRLKPEARERLELLATTPDGFRLAEADLALRRPGDLAGLRQAGLPGLAVADLARDHAWLARARDDARELLERWDDPALAALRARTEALLAQRESALGGG